MPDSLLTELTSPAAMLLGALLDGKLDWVDGIAIGRDTEAYTTLF